MPKMAILAAQTPTAQRISKMRRGLRGEVDASRDMVDSGSGMGLQAGESLRRPGLGRFASMCDAEHGRYEQKRCDGCKKQATDDGSPQRRILSRLDGHWRHADDHGELR